MTPLIRPARPDDAAAIAEIYTQGIQEGQATFETEPRSPEDIAQWMTDPAAPPFIVAEEEGRVLGWARLGPYNPRPCYDGVGEASLYVDRGARGRGVGVRLMEALAEEAARAGYWKLVGLLFPENQASVALCRAAGWREVGTFHRHGRLGGRWRDVIVVERLVSEAEQTSK
jgi:L-amino acid N-acyltransferase YncA